MRDAAVKEVTSLQASLRETEALLSQAETQVVQLRADAAETARRQGTLKATLHAVQEELRVTTAGFRVSTLNHQRAENQCMAFEDRRSRALEQHQREAAFRRTTGGWMKQLVLSPPPPVPLNDPVSCAPLVVAVRVRTWEPTGGGGVCRSSWECCRTGQQISARLRTWRSG